MCRRRWLLRVGPIVTSSVIADLLHKGSIHAFEVFAEAVPDGFVKRHGGVVASVSRSPIPLFNVIFVERPDATPGDLIAAMNAVEKTGIRFSAQLRSTSDDRFIDVLNESSLERGSEPPTPGMVLDPIFDFELPDELEIRTGGSSVFEDHSAVVAEAFGMSRELIYTFMNPSMIERDDLTLYAGYLHGEPVCASFGLVLESTVTVFNVATANEHRGRGYGAAMTMKAVLDGRAAGCNLAFLQSSPMGYSVYERLGFEKIVEYNEWVSPREG